MCECASQSIDMNKDQSDCLRQCNVNSHMFACEKTDHKCMNELINDTCYRRSGHIYRLSIRCLVFAFLLLPFIRPFHAVSKQKEIFHYSNPKGLLLFLCSKTFVFFSDFTGSILKNGEQKKITIFKMTFLKPLGPKLLTHKYNFLFPYLFGTFQFRNQFELNQHTHGERSESRMERERKTERTPCDIQSLRMWLTLKRKKMPMSIHNSHGCIVLYRMILKFSRINNYLIFRHNFRWESIAIWTNICIHLALLGWESERERVRLWNISSAATATKIPTIIPNHAQHTEIECAQWGEIKKWSSFEAFSGISKSDCVIK